MNACIDVVWLDRSVLGVRETAGRLDPQTHSTFKVESTLHRTIDKNKWPAIPNKISNKSNTEHDLLSEAASAFSTPGLDAMGGRNTLDYM